MSFLQPLTLAALPLILLPILIHLINRQRHRTIPWGAMMFLLDAKRLQRAMARLRYWLIMAMRMLAIAGLIFAASRPLASGRLGSSLGNRADTTIVLLDRSVSMEQQDSIARRSKRATALDKLGALLEATPGRRRTVLIESTRCRAEEIEASSLRQLPQVSATDTAADIPRMLQTALDYLIDNQVGQADIWVASDLRSNDWQMEDGRWASLRQGFAEREGVRFQLLTYAQASNENLSISLRNVRKRALGEVNELVMDVFIQCEGVSGEPQVIPVEFMINGARSVLEVEIARDEFALQGHVMPLDTATEGGWGRVSLPGGDDNPADDVYYFVFADEPVRHVTLVSSDDQATAPLRIAAVAPSDPTLEYAATVLSEDQVGELNWTETTLLLWQAPLPGDLVARQVQAFLASGRPVIFFPPNDPNSNEFAGVRWQQWQTAERGEAIQVASWRGDSDLLAKTLSGAALPLGKLNTLRYCRIEGVVNSLARLSTGDPLLSRADGNAPAYFCATLPRHDHSSLARDGVVLYIMIQRALSVGSSHQGDARQLATGSSEADQTAQWIPRSPLPESVASASHPFLAGAYQRDGTWVALNRPAAENMAPILKADALAAMFSGLDYRQISDELGAGSPLANEVWRAFLALMAVALIVEAALCLG